MKTVAAALSGFVFGLGLTVSQMINPAKVLAFLDLFGDWDPSLALVMAGALITAGVGYRVVWRQSQPLLGGAFQIPSRRDIDAPLLSGALLFGAGWGLAGLCPGPAIAGLGLGEPEVWLFVGGMLAGMALFRRTGAPAVGAAAPPT